MKAHTLMYHDVVKGADLDSSGFCGAGPARYKLRWSAFLEHLQALAGAVDQPPVTPDQLVDDGPAHVWSITFDDGGKSALDAAVELTERGWRAAFFVTTERVGRGTFLDVDGIRALAAAGHVVGSHSHSHPRRLSACSEAEIAYEWRMSTEILGEILGRPVDTGSVPGGYLSRSVVRGAAAAGIRVLCTSEPVRSLRYQHGCVLVGRFAVYDKVSAAAAAAAAAGGSAWLRQRATWTMRKAAKRLGGDAYVRARAALLERR